MRRRMERTSRAQFSSSLTATRVHTRTHAHTHTQTHTQTRTHAQAPLTTRSSAMASILACRRYNGSGLPACKGPFTCHGLDSRASPIPVIVRTQKPIPVICRVSPSILARRRRIMYGLSVCPSRRLMYGAEKLEKGLQFALVFVYLWNKLFAFWTVKGHFPILKAPLSSREDSCSLS